MAVAVLVLAIDHHLGPDGLEHVLVQGDVFAFPVAESQGQVLGLHFQGGRLAGHAAVADEADAAGDCQQEEGREE